MLWLAALALGITAVVVVANHVPRSSTEDAPPRAQQSKGTVAMVAALRALRAQEEREAARPEDAAEQNRWGVNRPQSIPALRAAVAEARTVADAIATRRRLGLELLWAGMNREALALFREVEAAAESFRGKMPDADLELLRAGVLADLVPVWRGSAADENCVCDTEGES